VYGGQYADDPEWQALRRDIDAFEKEHGRRPRTSS
jgi:hypothetical protein